VHILYFLGHLIEVNRESIWIVVKKEDSPDYVAINSDNFIDILILLSLLDLFDPIGEEEGIRNQVEHEKEEIIGH
jgi:hypothetical protein